MAKWNISAQKFYQNDGEVGRLVLPLTSSLDMCHKAHAAGSDASDDIINMSVEAGEAEVDAFYAKQRLINKGLANKIRHISYPVADNGLVSFIQFATFDECKYTASSVVRCLLARTSSISLWVSMARSSMATSLRQGSL